MAEADVLKETLDVTVNGETYTFRIPSYKDELRIGMRERNIRRDIDAEIGSGAGSIDGLDNGTFFLMRTAAILEVLLKQSTAVWPWSKDESGAPKVDYTKWPTDKVDEAAAVGVAYNAEIARFRAGGLRNANPDGRQVVEGEPDIGGVAV